MSRKSAMGQVTHNIDTTPLTQIPGLDVASERKRPRLEAMLFFDAFNKEENGKTNLMGVFDKFVVTEDSERHVTVPLFIRTAETLNAPVQLTVTDPNGKVVGTFDYMAQLTEEHPDIPVHVQIFGSATFQTEVEGVYWFALAFKDEVIGGTGLVIEFVKGEK